MSKITYYDLARFFFPTKGHLPAPRAAHASAILGNKGYICGGRVMVSVSGLFCKPCSGDLLPCNNIISTIQFIDNVDPPHDCFCPLKETRTSDIHCLDLESWTWSEM